MEKYPIDSHGSDEKNNWGTSNQEDTENIDVVKNLWEENKNEIKGAVEPILERIKEDDYIYILNAYDLNESIGDESLIGIFSSLLEIEPLRLVEDDSIDSIGGYKIGCGEIVLNRKKLQQNLYEEGIDSDKLPIHELGTIAHEMWHAYQFDIATKGGDRSDLYKEGFKDYKDYTDCDSNDWKFYGQIVELEAEYFGYMVSKELEKALRF